MQVKDQFKRHTDLINEDYNSKTNKNISEETKEKIAYLFQHCTGELLDDYHEALLKTNEEKVDTCDMINAFKKLKKNLLLILDTDIVEILMSMENN